MLIRQIVFIAILSLLDKFFVYLFPQKGDRPPHHFPSLNTDRTPFSPTSATVPENQGFAENPMTKIAAIPAANTFPI